MLDRPSVTAVIPTRNRCALLRFTLASVLAQSGVDVRVVVVDEGSSDDTPAFLRSLHSERVAVVTHPVPKGLPSARNAGLALAKTDWVAFVDDDDLWAPHKLTAQLTGLRRDPASGWSCVGAVWVDDRLRTVAAQRAPDAGDVLPRLLAVNVIPGGGSGVVARTDLLREIGGFDPDPVTAPAADWDCWIRLAERSPLSVVDAPLLAYRVASGSMSRDTARMEQALAGVRIRHAALAETVGVAPDPAAGGRYLANVEARAGRRLAPARRLATAAWRQRRPQGLMAAAAVLVSPRAALGAQRLHARLLRQPEWFAAAEAWLSSLRVAGADGRATGSSPPSGP